MKKMYIPKDVAKIICEMENVCYCEGIGPDSMILLSYIKKHYPELLNEYWWAEEMTKDL